jgi:hypothetical protein
MHAGTIERVRRVGKAQRIGEREMPKLIDPSYISEQMFDKVVKEKFQDNVDDPAVRDQAIKMLAMFRAGKTHDQIITDVLQAARAARRTSAEGVAEIGFLMGMQFGFELAVSFPPIK